MSLLEDLFLEDEAGEAQELERVLEGGGDEYDERPGTPNSDDDEEKDDEAVEDKRRVDPTKAKQTRVIKNPRFVLNPARLTGPRGIQVIPDHFKDFKFKGKGHEKEDLDMVLKKLEHWAYRLYPKFGFHDCLKKIETLGKKRPVMVHLHKIRSDQHISEETVVQQDSSDEEAAAPAEDEFDKLLQQQIELARATPAPSSAKKPVFSTPSIDRSHMMPKATSSPSISEEQRERMLRNRRLAEERKLAKLRNENASIDLTTVPLSENMITNDVVTKKHNKSNVIDSSDEEDVAVVNETVTVDVVVAKKHNKSIAIDYSDEEDLAFVSESVMTEDSVAHKHNKPNVVNSSDEEDVAIVNESVTVDVDVHSKVVNTTNDDEVTSHKNIDENMDVIAIDAGDDFDKLFAPTKIGKDSVLPTDIKDNEMEKDSETENQLEAENMKDNEIVPDTNSKHSVVDQHENLIENESLSRTVDKANDDVINIDDKNKESNIAKNNEVNSNKENVDSNIVEEIMDVDFSDDF